MTWKDVGNLRGNIGATGAKGDRGDTGPAGTPFTIFKTYETIALMEADFANVPDGSFVAIQSNVEDPDNAKLYLRGSSAFTFITDMSGATGIRGETGETGADGKAGVQEIIVYIHPIVQLNPHYMEVSMYLIYWQIMHGQQK